MIEIPEKSAICGDRAVSKTLSVRTNQAISEFLIRNTELEQTIFMWIYLTWL